jgi:hypothetical protein
VSTLAARRVRGAFVEGESQGAGLLLEYDDGERKSEQQTAHDDDQEIIALAADRTLRDDRQGQKNGPRTRLRTWPGYR